MEKFERKLYCSKCKIKTNHNIIRTYEEKSEPGSEFQWFCKYHIVQCAGCDEIAFVKQYGDEDMWEYEGEERFWANEVTSYPEQPLVEHNPRYWLESKEFRNLPESINTLYLQVIDVYNKGYLLLATIGIRTLIEAICLDEGINNGILRDEERKVKLNKVNNPISSGTLEGKIYGLYDRNMIILEQTIILQKIRDIGNAAVHEIKEPSIAVFKSAIQIIEQLLTNVYELKVHKLLKK